METTFISPGLALAIIGLMSVLILGFGVYVSKRHVKNANDFLYAGRNVGLALGTATLVAAWITGNTTMAAPELAYNVGLIGSLAISTMGLSLAMFAPLASRIKRLMPQGYSSGEFVRRRYGDLAWKLYLVLAVYYFLGFLVTQAMAGGILLQALSGVDYKIGMLTIMAVCTYYTLKGGLKAILATDFLLSLIILGTLFAVAAWSYWNFDLSQIYSQTAEMRPSTLNILTAAGLMFVGGNFLFGCGEIFHSNIWWQRVYASSERTASRSFVLAGLIWFAVPIVAGSLAFIAISQKYSIPQVNMIFPVVVSQIMGAGGAVLVLIIIYAALASTVSSLLTGAAGLIVNDIYRGVINPQASDQTVQRYVRYAIIVLAVVTAAIAWNPYESMYLVLLLTGPAVAAMIWPIVFGIYTRETNQKSAFWAMLLGTVAGLAAYFWISPYAAAIVSAVLSGLVVYLSTLMNPNRAFQWRQLDHEPAGR